MNQFTPEEIRAIVKYQRESIARLMEWIVEEKEKLEDLEKPDFLKTDSGADSGLSPKDEKAMDEELEFDNNADKKLEEGIVSEDELTDMFGEGGQEEVKEFLEEKENTV